MRILIDIGHPAHVHYFRNLINKLKEKNVKFSILARNKDVTHDLLNAYDISFKTKGRGGKRIFDRIGYTLRSLYFLHQEVNRFQPDICISFYSPYLALITRYHGIRHIMFNDTEGQPFFKQVVKLCRPEVYSPESYIDPLHSGQSLLSSYMELAYLHPDVYKPDSSVTELTGRNYVLFRFVSGDASHDFGIKGLSWKEKIEMVQYIKNYRNVWISSETQLPKELQKYQLDIAADKIHDVIAFANLVVGESATMSSEAAMLGVPAVLISQNQWGYIRELSVKYELVHYYRTDIESRKAALQKIVEILNNSSTKNIYRERRQIMLGDKQNMTKIMLEIINKANN